MNVRKMARRLVLEVRFEFPDELNPGLQSPTLSEGWTYYSPAVFKLSDLREWSAQTGQRKNMPVLFPEDPAPADLVGEPALPEEDPTPTKPTRADQTLLKIIRALATALADSDPGRFKRDGEPFTGYSKDKNTGIVGHLIEKKYSDLSGETIRRHIARSLK